MQFISAVRGGGLKLTNVVSRRYRGIVCLTYSSITNVVSLGMGARGGAASSLAHVGSSRPRRRRICEAVPQHGPGLCQQGPECQGAGLQGLIWHAGIR